MERIFVTIENGKKVEYDIIIQFTSNENGKKYIAYTNNKKNSAGKIEILCAYYEIQDDLYILTPIINEDEIVMFNQILKELGN